jgi:hypothetical protein
VPSSRVREDALSRKGRLCLQYRLSAMALFIPGARLLNTTGNVQIRTNPKVFLLQITLVSISFGLFDQHDHNRSTLNVVIRYLRY